MIHWLTRKRIPSIAPKLFQYHEADLHSYGSARFAFEPRTETAMFNSLAGFPVGNPPNPLHPSFNNLAPLQVISGQPGIIPQSEIFLTQLFRINNDTAPPF
jgi:hypothetical protein